MPHFGSGQRTARFALAPHSFIASKQSSRALIRVLGGLLVASLLSGCGESPEEARFKLSELGYEYSPAALFVAINDKDQVAVDLLMRAGLDPNERLPYRGLMQLGHNVQDTPELLQMLQGAAVDPWAPEIQEWLNRLNQRTINRYRATPLIVASVLENTPALQALLRAGADPNLPDSEANAPLFWAVAQHRVESARTLLDHGAEIGGDKPGAKNGDENPGAMVMQLAVSSGVENRSTELLELILDAGGKAAVRDTPVVPALTVAAGAGSLEHMELLLDAGAAADARDARGSTALVQAVKSHSFEAVEALLDEDADPNLPGRGGETPLMAVFGSDGVEIAQALLDAGADPNAQSEDGKTPLMDAAGRGDVERVQLLLDAGANPNLRTRSGDTALGFALDGAEDRRRVERLDTFHIDGGAGAMRKPSPVVETLLAGGADPNVPDNAGETLIARAIDEGLVGDAQMLLEAGADPNIRDDAGNTLLMRSIRATSSAGSRFSGAAKATEQELFAALLKRVAESDGIDLQNNDGLTALMLAARHNVPEGIQALLDAGAERNVQEQHGSTALVLAAEYGYTDAARALLSGGCDPDIQNDKGHTALMYAAARADLPMVNGLLAAGADPTLVDGDGNTALNYVPRFRKQVREAIQSAATRAESQQTAAAPEPARPPATAPSLENRSAESRVPTEPPSMAGGPAQGLTHEKILANARQSGMTAYALSGDGEWCGKNVVVKIEAESADVFSDGRAAFLIRRIGRRLGQDDLCPVVRSAEVYGYTAATSEPVFRGTSTASDDWALN